MANIYGGIDLIGGGTGAIDKINGSVLNDKDIFVTIKDGIFYPHWLDDDSNAGENSPLIISPDLNAGTKRWLLAGGVFADLTIYGKIGVGIVTPLAYQLHIRGASFPPTILERTTAVTNSAMGTTVLKVTSSGNMVDGFGGGFIFQLEDEAGVANNAAAIYAIRDGGDALGALQFRTGGISSVRITVKADGKIGFNNPNPDAKFDLAGSMLFTGASSGLPFGEISVVSNATETAIASQNVYVQITTFDTNGESLNVTPDHTNDHLTITKAGRYFISCSITLNSVGGAGSIAEMEVKKNNGTSRIGSLHADRTLAGGGAESGAITLTGIANLSVSDTIEVWIKNETNTQNYIVEDITLTISQKGG